VPHPRHFEFPSPSPIASRPSQTSSPSPLSQGLPGEGAAAAGADPGPGAIALPLSPVALGARPGAGGRRGGPGHPVFRLAGLRLPGPRSEPSGFLSPGRCPADAQPTEAETAVWNQVNAVLEEAQGVLAELQSYTGAGQEIREVGAAPLPTTHPAARGDPAALPQAIQNPGDLRLQERAWSAVCPLVAKLKRFYEFSLRLGEGSEPPFPPPAPPPASCAPPTTSNSGGPHPGGALPRASVSPAGAGVVTGGALSAENALRSLLEALTSPPYAPTQHLEREQALAKQFAEILHFTLSFDELKMTNPAIQNDFSYYRRTISRNRINNLQLDAESEVNNEMANRMSLFYAEATPMLKTLSNATTKFVSENKTLPIEDTTDCLSTMACVCRVMLETPEYRSRFTNTETLLFCMRVMVGVIILYDHVHPVGAFAKTSKIDMKGCIKVLKEQPSTSTEGLLNALR
uniref:CYRIA/CYRIB Rac1 binding domain-containing protein n=1 Tax=Anas platyrhynchos platyrhynchos TaxID=8840 RepID=A0A493U1B8_ANAPP